MARNVGYFELHRGILHSPGDEQTQAWGCSTSVPTKRPGLCRALWVSGGGGRGYGVGLLPHTDRQGLSAACVFYTCPTPSWTTRQGRGRTLRDPKRKLSLEAPRVAQGSLAQHDSRVLSSPPITHWAPYLAPKRFMHWSHLGFLELSLQNDHLQRDNIRSCPRSPIPSPCLPFTFLDSDIFSL